MSLSAWGMLLGVMILLPGGAHAAEPGTTAEPAAGKSQKKIAAMQYEYSANKKNKTLPAKNASPAAKAADERTVEPLAPAAVKDVQDDATPPDPSGRSLRLKGVRG